MEADGADAEVGRARGVLRRLEDALLALLLTAMILLASLQILLRNLFDTGIAWADPMVRVLVLWLGLLGALAASRDDRHIDVDVLSRLLPAAARSGVRRLTSLLTSGVAALVAFQAGRFVLAEFELGGTAFGAVRTWMVACVVPLAFAGMALRYLHLATGRGRPASRRGHETP